MKIFSLLKAVVEASQRPNGGDGDQLLGWIRDPLTHPEIERMDERERGDLPFNTGFRRAPPDVRDAGCRA